MKKWIRLCTVILGILLIQNVIFASEYLSSDSPIIPPISHEPPKIIEPANNIKITSTQDFSIQWQYTGDELCTVSIFDENNIEYILTPTKDKTEYIFHSMYLTGNFFKGAKYNICINANGVSSEPITLYVATENEELVMNSLNTQVKRVGEPISQDKFFPNGLFESAEDASKAMSTIEVNVWKVKNKSEKVPSTLKITVNSAIAETVQQVFNEIYENELQFPVHSAESYTWRETKDLSRLSEHAFGTAIDINANENFCIYSNGTTVGSHWKPYEDPHSVTAEIVNIFRKYNFRWGGSWDSPNDYMHFSYFGT